MKFIGACVTAILLAACTSTTGVQITEDQLSQLKRSGASIETVQAAFGKPQSVRVLPSGQRMLTYSYQTVSVGAGAFVPLVGAAMPGSGFSSETASLVFKNGVLDSYYLNSSNHGTGATIRPNVGG